MSKDYFTGDFTLTIQGRTEEIKLSNGDIFETYGMLLEYEDVVFYGIVRKQIPIRGLPGNCKIGHNYEYVRTGISFTKEEFNKVVKEIEKWNIV